MKYFLSSEVAKITGASTGLQREWRRQRLIAPKRNRKWKKYTLREVAHIYVLKSFSNHGFPMKGSREIVEKAVEAVLKEIKSGADSDNYLTLKDGPLVTLFDVRLAAIQIMERMSLSSLSRSGGPEP